MSKKSKVNNQTTPTTEVTTDNTVINEEVSQVDEMVMNGVMEDGTVDMENEQSVAIETAAPIIVKAMEAITAVVADSISVAKKWSLLLDIMARTDESSLPIEQCSQAELNRRLKLLASQKTAEKKISETSDLFKAIVAKEEAIKALKVNVGRTTNKVSSTSDPATLNQTELAAYIRGIQSKKCTLKKVLMATPVGTEAYETVSNQMNEVFKQEAAAIELRKSAPADATAPKAKKISKEMETKITTVLAALGQLEQSEEVVKQIAALKELLG